MSERLYALRGATSVEVNSTEAILAARPHPEQGYRSCLGILRLSKKYGGERVEIDALDFIRTLSGRLPGTGVLSNPLPL